MQKQNEKTEFGTNEFGTNELGKVTYQKGFKAICLNPFVMPNNFKEWIYFIWGWDIFIGNFPFLKFTFLVSIILSLLV